jgi:hypothetical protein
MNAINQPLEETVTMTHSVVGSDQNQSSNADTVDERKTLEAM